MTTRKSNRYIDNYINAVRSSQIVASKDVHLLFKLIETKLTMPNVYVDHDEIEEAISSIKKYFPFKLFLWEKFVIACLFGLFIDDGSLMFDEF